MTALTRERLLDLQEYLSGDAFDIGLGLEPEDIADLRALASQALDAQEREAAANFGDLRVIWSKEHGAWWGPHRKGYCAELLGAGLYTPQEAETICGDGKQEVHHSAHERWASLVGAQRLGSVLALVTSDAQEREAAAISNAVLVCHQLAAESEAFAARHQLGSAARHDCEREAAALRYAAQCISARAGLEHVSKTNTTPERVSETAKSEHALVWPTGCIDYESCERHRYCTYSGCRHEGRVIAPEIDAALARLEATGGAGE